MARIIKGKNAEHQVEHEKNLRVNPTDEYKQRQKITTSSRSPVHKQGRKQQSRRKHATARFAMSRAAMVHPFVATVKPNDMNVAMKITNVLPAIFLSVFFLISNQHKLSKSQHFQSK